MSRTQFDGPLASGDKQAGTPGGANVGLAVLSQSLPLVGVAGPSTVSTTINLPARSQILAFYTDVATAFDNAASAALTVGNVASGTQYLSSVDLKVAGRAAFAPSAAQIAAYASVTTPLIATVALGAGAGVAGAATVTIVYIQKD